MQLLGLASALGIDVEMVNTAHPLKHIDNIPVCGKHYDVHFCPSVRLDQRIFLVFLWFYFEYRTLTAGSWRTMTVEAGADFDGSASMLSIIN